MTIRPDTRVRRDVRGPLVVGAVFASGAALVAFRDPAAGGYGFCPILAITGFFCAGCGGLRAVHALATGDLAGSWSMNPLVTIAVPIVVLLWLTWMIRVSTGRPPWHPPIWILVAVAAIALTFALLRNIPVFHAALGPEAAGWLLPFSTMG